MRWTGAHVTAPVARQAGPEQRNPFHDLAALGQRPSPVDGSNGAIPGKAVLVRNGEERFRSRQQFLTGARRPINHASFGQRNSQAERMTQFVRLVDGCRAPEARFIEVAQVTQIPRKITEQGDQGVREHERQRAVRRIESSERLLQVRARPKTR